MKLYNCTLSEAPRRFAQEKLILFGTGAWLKSVETSIISSLSDQILYFIDNDKTKNTVIFAGKQYDVHTPEFLRKEKNAVIILTSPVYMYDMYIQLEGLGLDESLSCFSFPFMQQASETIIDTELLKQGLDVDRKACIPKVIHGFWFSGEEKPEEYQKCFDTWKKVCPDYEIKEWNLDNYHSDHPYFKRAIECKAWAFATDYARLDVISKYGGFYLDMDVELIKSLDELRGNKAVFEFANSVIIDLAVFGAEKNHHMVNNLIHLYDDLELPQNKDEFKKYWQPGLVSSTFEKYGIELNGEFQLNSDMLILSSTFFFPMNYLTYELTGKTEYTIGIHHDNFGWSTGGENKRDKKLRDNRKMWGMIENYL